MKNPKLTDAEADALMSAAQAMLAGEEGAGDAEGVSFKKLHAAIEKLQRALDK